MDVTLDHPRLVVLEPSTMRGAVLPVTDRRTTVGRGDATLRLADPQVSRLHAALSLTTSGIVVEDLESTGGTWVNGVPVQQPRLLYPGDVVAFGPVRARYEVGPAVAYAAGPPTAPSPAISYHVRDQYADQLNNVAGNQYNTYLQSVIQQRDSFLRDIAGTRTRARRLIVFGFVLLVAGFAAFAVPLLRFLQQVGDSMNQPDAQVDPPWETNGFPIGLIGWAVSALGSILMIVGIVLHVAASARRRRLDQSMPLPTVPWQPQYPPNYGR